MSEQIGDTLEHKMLWLQIGTCSCSTKSAALEYHDDKCNYRVAVEATAQIAALKSDNEKAFWILPNGEQTTIPPSMRKED